MAPPAPGGVPRNPPDVRALVVVALYAAGWVAVLFAVNLITVALLFLPAAQHGFSADALRETLRDVMGMVKDGIPAWILATTLVLQMPAMLGLAEGVRRLVSRNVWRDAALEDWRVGYGWTLPKPAAVGIAGLLGLTTGWLPGWLAARMAEAFPALSLGSMDLINKALTNGGSFARGIVLAGIVLGAPLVEELVFRGFMWRTMERSYGRWVTWVATSLMFAFYHMDPIQSTALIFTALVLGWVRMQSGSVLPGIVLHFVNNSLGAAGAVMGVGDGELSFVQAFGGAMISVALCVALARVPGLAADDLGGPGQV